jgi:spore germination protein YaaH
MDIWGGTIMTNDKKLLTWSLRVTADDYRHDYEEYGNKITSIGLHEWDIDGSGKIAMYKKNPVKWNSTDDPDPVNAPNWGYYKTTYVDTNGVTQPGWIDATTFDRYKKNSFGSYSETLFPNYIEPDMKRWDHIEYFMQFVIFTPDVVTKVLDSQTVQDTLIANMKTVISRFRKDQNGVDLGYTGIEMDIEGSFSDSKWDSRSGDDDKYIAFLKRIKNEVIIDANPDFKLRINAHAMWNEGFPDYYRFHNYKLFAESKDKNGHQLFDEVQIMSYDFAWSGSAPGPSTPIYWLEEICVWVDTCFNPAKNPKAVCTLEDVWIGGAGYGRRWGIYSDDNWGTSVTYRNLIDWQNGYYITNRDSDTGEMADQDFIPLNAFNDPVSDNQIMYPGIYDYLKAKHFETPLSMGQITARLSEYNGIQYTTAYSKNQHVTFTNVRGMTGRVGINEPKDTNGVLAYGGKIKLGQTAELDLDGTIYEFQGYRTVKRPYKPLNGVCQLSDQPETILTYTVNVPSAGSYDLVAVVSFPFFGQSKLGGRVNGSSTTFTIGGDGAPDYYPMMIKGVHVWDMGNFNLVAGDNTITIEGPLCEHGSIIYGFVACDSCTTEVIGGYLNGSPNIKQYKKRDGSPAKLPNQLVFTSEVLQQSPRPVIMWEDFLKQWLNDDTVRGKKPDGSGTYYTESEKTVYNAGLQATTYYQVKTLSGDDGSGTTLQTQSDGSVICVDPNGYGYSQGFWDVVLDADDNVVTQFKPGDARGGGVTSGQLMLNYKFRTVNVSVQAQFNVKSGDKVGIRFGSAGVGDGYLFLLDYKTQMISVIYETDGTIVASVSLGDHTVAYGDRITLEIKVNNGQGRFTIGDLNLFPQVTLSLPNMKQGSMGFYSNNAEVDLFMLSLRTTERWETLERFELMVEGQAPQPLGEIDRPGITRDQFGFLMYSGLNELNTRSPDAKPISLDYIFKPVYFPTFTGKKTVTIKLVDAGLWYKNLYIGDAEGMSITYAGDSESFNKAMNIAVYDTGCKGIGLWVLGQGDPRIYETLPDVVAWHPKP